MTPSRAVHLVRVYPRAWRAIYGEDFVTLLEREPLTPGVVVNVAAGALDAWVSPKNWLHDPVAANAYTLRFWRVPMPTQGRSVAREILLMVALVISLRTAGAAASWASGDRTIDHIVETLAVPVAPAVVGVAVWFRDFSLRTKLVAAVAMSAFAWSVLTGIDWAIGP